MSKTNTNTDELLPSEELLKKRPEDPRAWHCQTVDEFYLWKFSSDYSGFTGGYSEFDEEARNEDYEIYC
ncbi:MAG: hypothetical protein GY804_00285 [Alphaproteobacteria bacterium]|nr:hypothetical protein [Alphaproteobacteria bacterium]